jgi:topoisomerase-4 subunit A
MDEIDEGTVDFKPNYDGSTQEPSQLPARLPFNLLNGASGIAVGLATEIPSHNLGEVAQACMALLKNPKLSDQELFGLIPGPDFPGGGQIISPAADIEDAYLSGRGSIKCRARWKIEDLARGQWQLVVTELPPGVSTQRVLEEIEEITNPKIKTGKKALSIEQVQIKATLLSVLDVVRDESSKSAAVRLVCEPKTSRIEQQELITTLLAHTSLETSTPVNLTMVGLDGRPTQKSLRQMLTEWLEFRQATIERRSRFRLDKVTDRIHILEGRQLVLLSIDEVISIIRQSDDPKAALIARFGLSERQVEDILEIRLRQLARLEAIKIEQELASLSDEKKKLEDILGNPASLRRLMSREIESDAKQFADPRRTLIQAERKAVLEVKIVDEAVTVVVSQKGWVRAQKGWAKDRPASAAASVASSSGAEYAFKSGDALYAAFECRTVDTLLAFGSNGRIYSVPVSMLPGGRGDGQPVNSLIELESGTQLLHYFAGSAQAQLLLSSTGGYGFMATVENMISRQKAGKSFVTCNADEIICKPSVVFAPGTSVSAATHVACASTGGRILTFELSELKVMTNGGRGLMLIDLEAKDALAGAAAYTRSVRIEGLGRGGKEREETLEIRSLNNARFARGRKGKAADLGFKPATVTRVE